MGFFHDLKVKKALRKLDKTQGGIPEVQAILKNRKAFRKWADGPMTSMLNESTEGADFLADPVGKIGDGTLLKLFLANLPQLIAALASILALFPHAAMEAFDWQTVLHVIGEVVPNITDITKDALAGMSLTDLVAKYGDEEITLFEDVLHELTSK